jgi:hypothetical protein
MRLPSLPLVFALITNLTHAAVPGPPVRMKIPGDTDVKIPTIDSPAAENLPHALDIEGTLLTTFHLNPH